MFVKEAVIVSAYIQRTVLLIICFNELKHFCGLWRLYSHIFYDKTSIAKFCGTVDKMPIQLTSKDLQLHKAL